MNETAQAYERLTEIFIKWAKSDQLIRMAFILGSRARVDHPADNWSDMDIALVVTDQEPYISEAEWIKNIANPWLTVITSPGYSIMERRVLFEGGLDVDFLIIPVDMFRQIIEMGVTQLTSNVFGRGVRVLLDKDGLSARLGSLKAMSRQLQPPSEPELLGLVNDFWYQTAWASKKLRRGELWTAHGCCDSYMKNLLLQMMEWHTRVVKDSECDTWMRGRFFEEWADPRALKELEKAFAYYDKDDIWRALFATMDLFNWLSRETAKRLGYPYPDTGVEHTIEIVKELFREDKK